MSTVESGLRAHGPESDYEALMGEAADAITAQSEQIKAVLAMHVAEGNGCCISCWDFNEDKDVKFPCPTSIALGVDPQQKPW
ncbi:hypothetical protein [Arthrobacter agilis]|uniref:hypothetical protein n=1 Tax=Arthrobacter agilis TaxID=37921 RepID=UPI00278895FA|nr:hypothetical protein [Arthrobacter agilis]MDQ0735158.1 hypothetical protein [Arthrobacter agilis]